MSAFLDAFGGKADVPLITLVDIDPKATWWAYGIWRTRPAIALRLPDRRLARSGSIYYFLWTKSAPRNSVLGRAISFPQRGSRQPGLDLTPRDQLDVVLGKKMLKLIADKEVEIALAPCCPPGGMLGK